MASGAVDDLRLLVEDVDDLVERGHRSEEGVVELGELLDWVEEVGQIADEGEERPDLDRTVEGQVPPYPSTTDVAAAERKSTKGK